MSALAEPPQQDQAKRLLVDAIRFHEGTVARSATTAATMIWNALQCGKKLQELACLARENGESFDVLIEEGRGDASPTNLRRHLALYRNLPHVVSFKQVLEAGWKSLREAQISAGVVKDRPPPAPDTPDDEEDERRRLEDIEFCRLSGDGSGYVLRVSVLGPPGAKYVAERREVSLRTADTVLARHIRDVCFNLLEKCGIAPKRTLSKMEGYRSDDASLPAGERIHKGDPVAIGEDGMAYVMCDQLAHESNGTESATLPSAAV